jgi:hypothetical protein
MSSSAKVLVDTEGGNNLLYLPLDQLIQQRVPEADTSQIGMLPFTNSSDPQPGVAETTPPRSVRR